MDWHWSLTNEVCDGVHLSDSPSPGHLIHPGDSEQAIFEGLLNSVDHLLGDGFSFHIESIIDEQGAEGEANHGVRVHHASPPTLQVTLLAYQ